MVDPCRHLLTLGPDHESQWVRLYVHDIDGVWAAMIVADDVPPPKPKSQIRPRAPERLSGR